MESFQEAVSYALSHFNIYNFHPPDMNISDARQVFKFTVTKPADFIISNAFGLMGFLEIKNISSPKFYVKSNEDQFARARNLCEQFGTYYYIVNFQRLSQVHYFRPSEIRDVLNYDPLLYPERQINWIVHERRGYFGAKKIQKVLNVLRLPYFVHRTRTDAILPSNPQEGVSP